MCAWLFFREVVVVFKVMLWVFKYFCDGGGGGLEVTVSYSMRVCETHIVIGGIFDCSDAQHQH